MFTKNLRAILGPTNTGKTYFAIERMLAHSSGIMCFPLRLLARENYDKIIKVVDKNKVALITGEEKIVPKNAVYFCCTIEAMPINKKVEFIGIDEVQIASDFESLIIAALEEPYASCGLSSPDNASTEDIWTIEPNFFLSIFGRIIFDK